MEKEELLKPRYKVIADYPNGVHKIGDTLTHLIAGTFINERIRIKIELPQNYPVIFKPLQWWEERATEELPEYINFEGIIYNVRWEDYLGVRPVCNDSSMNGQWHFNKNKSLPATLDEYTSYLTSQTTKN